MRSLSSWICRLNSSVRCFSFSNACSRSHTCSRFKALDNNSNSYFRVGRVPLFLRQKFECHYPKVCSTNRPILKPSPYLQQLQNVIHGVIPINRRRARQATQRIQLLQLSQGSKHQKINKTRSRIAADKHGVRVLVCLVHVVRLVDRLGNLHTHNCDRVIAGSRVGYAEATLEKEKKERTSFGIRTAGREKKRRERGGGR